MKKLLKVKAVVFDRDGVIINTDGIVIGSVKKAFEKFGFALDQDFSLADAVIRSAREVDSILEFI